MEGSTSCILLVVVLGVALSFDVLISNNIHGTVYNQRPAGKCKTIKFEGCEDIIMLPNEQAIITTGARMWHLEHVHGGPKGALYMLNMRDPFVDPIKLLINREYLENNPEFNPHASSFWINEKGEIHIYVICHKRTHDSIEVFLYNPLEFTLTYDRSVSHGSLFGLNNIVAVGEHEVYVTSAYYFATPVLLMAEKLFRLPLMNVVYVNSKTGDVKVAVSKLRSPNGINRSRNNKYVYVANALGGEVVAYTRNDDNTLSRVQSYTVPMSADNLSVDELTGDIWLAVLHKPLESFAHFENFSVPVPSQVLHITVDEGASEPFSRSRIERVFESDGTDKHVNGVSTGLHHNGTLLLSTMFTGMMICDNK